MSADFRGDPSAALLEVLDPEQNATFSDHYLDCEYDLTNVMFVCTANALHQIPEPLMDRMEILSLSGYTELEKLAIAKKYLYKKEIEQNGLKPENIVIEDSAYIDIIRLYTKEAGVRSLERAIAALCRKAAMDVVDNSPDYKVVINSENIPL